MEGTGQIHVQGPPQVLGLVAEDEPVDGEPGVVDENVQATEPLGHLLDACGASGGVSDVELQGVHLGRARSLGCGLCFLGSGIVPRVGDGNGASAFGKAHCNRPADAARSPGHERRLTLEVPGHARLLRDGARYTTTPIFRDSIRTYDDSRRMPAPSTPPASTSHPEFKRYRKSNNAP